MKRILIAAALLVSAAAHAAPFYTVDVVAGTTSCGITVDAQPKVNIPVTVVAPSAARPTGVYCAFDVAVLAPGSHTIKATAQAVADAVYGTQESPENAPLTTVKPPVPAVPTNPKLSPTAD